MELKEIDRQLVLNYLQGNYTPGQLSRIQEYLHDEAYRESLDKFLREDWEAISSSPGGVLPEMELQYHKFQSYCKQDRKQPARVRRWLPNRFSRLAVAAAVLALVLVSARFLQPWLSGRLNQNVAGQWIVFHNEPGKRNRIVLPDSSLIYLGTASTLKYNADYNRTNRRILLDGEAYFVVRHGGRQPFTVITGHISTVDIGTEFNISWYPGKPSIDIAVVKGKVEVQSTKGESNTRIAAIGQGQALQYDTLTAKSVVYSLPDTTLVGAWRKGILSFRRRPMREVTDELERYYGVSIRYENPASADILLTTLLDNKTLEDALEIVTVTAGVRYTREGNTIVLK
jgi:ferric-dicitrate binding protein FerR (iron transport regulator)